jgi:hypothetical protein
MPVSFAVLECESEAPKVAVRGWRKLPTKNYPLVASAARAPLPSGRATQTEGPELASTRPLTAARERSPFDVSPPYSAAIPTAWRRFAFGLQRSVGLAIDCGRGGSGRRGGREL